MRTLTLIKHIFNTHTLVPLNQQQDPRKPQKNIQQKMREKYKRIMKNTMK